MAEQSLDLTAQGATAPASEAAAASVWVAFAVMCGFIVFLLWGTGFATDDYVFLLEGLTQPIADNLWPKAYISEPILHYTHALPYFVIGDRPWAYDLLKAAYAVASVYFVSRFFNTFCSPRRSLLLAFLFIFLPLHDATVYSLTNTYLTVSFACYLYAYALGANGRLRESALFALLGSFSSYGSPPIAFGLAFLALLRRQRKLVGALVVPNLIYIAYYLVTSLGVKIGKQRLTGEFSVAAIAKQMIVQLASFLDAAIGPSAWAKIIYCISSLDVLGWLVAIAAAIALILYIAPERRTGADGKLLAAATVILCGSFGMFSLTGLYPQMAFSLGDRVMIYGSFFLICLLATLRMPRFVESSVVLVLVLAIVGISTHWKQWTRHVDQIAANIRNNTDIRALPARTLLYVSHNQYSRLGPYANIDFFTVNYVVQTFFTLQLGDSTPLRFASFNGRLVFENGELRDRKYGNIAPVAGGIWLYDSQRNALQHVDANDIQMQIEALPPDIRHWTQQLKVPWIDSLITQIAPNMRYAYSPSQQAK